MKVKIDYYFKNHFRLRLLGRTWLYDFVFLNTERNVTSMAVKQQELNERFLAWHDMKNQWTKITAQFKTQLTEKKNAFYVQNDNKIQYFCSSAGPPRSSTLGRIQVAKHHRRTGTEKDSGGAAYLGERARRRRSRWRWWAARRTVPAPPCVRIEKQNHRWIDNIWCCRKTIEWLLSNTYLQSQPCISLI